MTPGPTGTTSDHRGVIAAAVVTVVFIGVGAVALFLGLRGDGGHASPPSVAAAATARGGSTPTSGRAPSRRAPLDGPARRPRRPPPDASTSRGAGAGHFLAASQPTRIAIPSIGLTSTTFVDLTVQQDGTLSVPGTEDEVGLYQAGPTPGQLGPAVLGAHVDSPGGRRGVFWSLGKVRVGDTIDVTRKDGTTATFSVDRVKAYPKATFPTDLVYKGDFTRSEIRLVTCGGPVDSRNEYRTTSWCSATSHARPDSPTDRMACGGRRGSAARHPQPGPTGPRAHVPTCPRTPPAGIPTTSTQGTRGATFVGVTSVSLKTWQSAGHAGEKGHSRSSLRVAVTVA